MKHLDVDNTEKNNMGTNWPTKTGQTVAGASENSHWVEWGIIETLVIVRNFPKIQLILKLHFL